MAATLRFPDGSSARPYIIGSVKQHDNGVEVLTTNGTSVVFIYEPDMRLRQRIAETINACMDANKNFTQPDWQTLYADWCEEFGLTQG